MGQSEPRAFLHRWVVGALATIIAGVVLIALPWNAAATAAGLALVVVGGAAALVLLFQMRTPPS